jgi:hypothetical protein
MGSMMSALKMIDRLVTNDTAELLEELKLTKAHHGAQDLMKYHEKIIDNIRKSRLPNYHQALTVIEQAQVKFVASCVVEWCDTSNIESIMHVMGYSLGFLENAAAKSINVTCAVKILSTVRLAREKQDVKDLENATITEDLLRTIVELREDGEDSCEHAGILGAKVVELERELALKTEEAALWWFAFRKLRR